MDVIWSVAIGGRIVCQCEVLWICQWYVCVCVCVCVFCFVFFFNDTATTEIYTLSLHDALPIYGSGGGDFLLQLTAEPGPTVAFVASRGNEERRRHQGGSSRASSTRGVLGHGAKELRVIDGERGGGLVP